MLVLSVILRYAEHSSDAYAFERKKNKTYTKIFSGYIRTKYTPTNLGTMQQMGKSVSMHRPVFAPTMPVWRRKTENCKEFVTRTVSMSRLSKRYP